MSPTASRHEDSRRDTEMGAAGRRAWTNGSDKEEKEEEEAEGEAEGDVEAAVEGTVEASAEVEGKAGTGGLEAYIYEREQKQEQVWAQVRVLHNAKGVPLPVNRLWKAREKQRWWTLQRQQWQASETSRGRQRD